MINTELLESETEEIQKQEEESAGVLSSISPFRVFFAAMIGLAVVVYMFIKDFDAEEFGKIEFSSHVFFWIGMASFFMCFRHVCTRELNSTFGHDIWEQKNLLLLIFMIYFISIATILFKKNKIFRSKLLNFYHILNPYYDPDKSRVMLKYCIGFTVFLFFIILMNIFLFR